MTPSRVVRVVVVLTVCLLTIGAVATPVSAGDSAVVFSFDQYDYEAEPGETVEINATFASHGDNFGNGITDYEATVEYDPDTLTVVDAESKSWFDNDANTSATLTTDEPGEVTVAASQDPADNGETGSGPIASITFEVATDAPPGDRSIGFTNTVANTTGPYPLGAIEHSGTITVLDEERDDSSDSASGAGDDGDPIPGFGVVAVLASTLAILAVFAVRLRRESRPLLNASDH